MTTSKSVNRWPSYCIRSTSTSSAMPRARSFWTITRTSARAASLSLSDPLDTVRANAEALADLGVTELICGWPGEGRPAIEAFATQVLPDLLAR